jgi:hypothetical protein
MNEEAYRDGSGTDLWIRSDRIWHPELQMRSASIWDMTHAHIMCWDCSGAVVIESFNYTEQSWLLADLFWWCSLASVERMGLDQSVTEVKADFDGQKICTKFKLPPSTKLFYCGVPDDDISHAQQDDPDLTTLYHYIGPHPHFPS